MPHGARQRPAPAILLAVLAVHAACASTATRPGTGDLSFRLRWDGPADLDLHVEDPHGNHIGVFVPHDLLSEAELAEISRTSRQGVERSVEEENRGILDVDCNASPDRICDHPIENVYWPTGTAPRGAYRARVILFQELHGDEQIPFVLEIRRGETVVREVPGRVGDARRASPWIEQEY